MEKLDVKDRKILYELNLDSRQSFAKLGKKVGLHKDSVALRVKKLQKREIIKNFYTDVNSFKLGYTDVKFYLTYQNITPGIKQEIIDYLVKNPYTVAVHSLEGQYDLCVISAVKNVGNFYNIWSNIINRYKDYFSNQTFCVTSKHIEYRKFFLLDEIPEKKDTRIHFTESSDDEKAEVDSLDKEILDRLVSNSRIPTLEVAQTIHASANTIKSRMSRFEKTGVINRYSINIDWSKIGYQSFKADIVLKDSKKIPQIMDYIEYNTNLDGRMVSLGYVDLELIFVLHNANQLHQIIEEVSAKFPDTIRSYKYFSVTKTYKYETTDIWNR